MYQLKQGWTTNPASRTTGSVFTGVVWTLVCVVSGVALGVFLVNGCQVTHTCYRAESAVDVPAYLTATTPANPHPAGQSGNPSEDVIGKLQAWTGNWIAVCSLIVSGGALLVAVMAGLNVWRSHELEGRIDAVPKRIKDKADSAVKQIDEQLVEVRGKLESLATESSGIRERFVEEVQDRARLFADFVEGLKARTRDGLPADKESTRKILDEMFKPELEKYEARSYLADLHSTKPQQRIAGIWALEQIGGKGELRALQEVSADPDQPSDVRVQAERSVHKMRRRLAKNS